LKRVSERKLEDLISVGPAILRDFALLGINTVAELARREPEALYGEFCRKTRKQQDVCVLDTFRAAIEQARDPSLPPEKCVWWYWSRVPKASVARGSRNEQPREKVNLLSQSGVSVLFGDSFDGAQHKWGKL
jgi:hypothetical protein